VKAQNLVLLPGLMCDARLWSPQIEALDIDARVADLSKFGTIAELAGGVLTDAPDRFALAGLSMGGIVAFEILRQAPERVTHLALIDTTPYPDTDEKRSTRLEQVHKALHGGLRDVATESLKPVYLAEANRNDQPLLDVLLDMSLDMGPEVFRRQSLALSSRPDSVSTLATIDCPTTIICGDEDRICPVKLHEFMARRIPNARLRIAGNCGHISTLERPDVVNEELAKLIAV
jgi:pimeloyl-ACP methyl ester carboxylesterase